MEALAHAFSTFTTGIPPMPAERSTTYDHLRVFSDPAQDPDDPLNRVENTRQFGSYQELIRQKNFRFKAQYEGKA